jgi:hypothetical protein
MYADARRVASSSLHHGQHTPGNRCGFAAVNIELTNPGQAQDDKMSTAPKCRGTTQYVLELKD